MLENLGHFLDTENQLEFNQYKKQGYSNMEISDLIAKNISIGNILREASKKWMVAILSPVWLVMAMLSCFAIPGEFDSILLSER
jgi:hypothetical protein